MNKVLSETKLIDLRGEIAEKRNWAFTESNLGTVNHNFQIEGMVNAYDICLGLIQKKLNKNKGKILSPHL